MVARIVKTAFNNVLKAGARAALSVGEHSNEALSLSRMNTCKKCPNFKSETQQCNVCGCFMDIKVTMLRNRNPYAAGRVEVTHCPEGRWNDKHIANHYREMDGKELLV